MKRQKQEVAERDSRPTIIATAATGIQTIAEPMSPFLTTRRKGTPHKSPAINPKLDHRVTEGGVNPGEQLEGEARS